ncbi:hypothetical protein ACRRTK_010070 [Alexandromys fortis]
MAPTDLTLKPGQDDQITVRSPEWKGGVLDQLSKHFESENVLSMKSGQEAKPADKKPKEIKFKVQFKDTPSFESTPKLVVHSVKPEEAKTLSVNILIGIILGHFFKECILKNYQSLETLELLSCLWPQVKDFKQSQTQPATGSKRMTLDLKNHATEMTVLTCKIHLISTPEGHGEIWLHLGFRLHIGKRPQVSKYRERNRADTLKNPSSSSHRKAKIYTPASKSPTSTRDFQSRSSQSLASVPVHRRQKQWGSRGVAGKTEAKDSGHYEFCEVLSTSESGAESNRHEKWAKSRLRKTSDLKYPMKKITKELKMQNIKLYKNSRFTEECPSGTLTDPSRSKSIETTQISTISSKRQPKKSSQPRFLQLLFQGLKQAFQRAHRVMAITGQKPEDRASPDNLWSSKNLYPKEKDEDDCLTGDDRGASTPDIKQRFMGSTPKKEDRLQETCDQAQQSKQVSSLQPRPLELVKNIVSERNVVPSYFNPTAFE